MAVYKSTYCSPLLNNIDPRVISSLDDLTPCEWIKCLVNSSNKLITGYKICLLDGENNIIFSSYNDFISPISELAHLLLNSQINSGLNGTQLQIPFFQNWNNKKLSSYNAIYYMVPYYAHYVLDMTTSESAGWSYSTATQTWSKDGWDGHLNNEATIIGELVFVAKDSDHNGLFVINDDGNLEPYIDENERKMIQGETGYQYLTGDGTSNVFRVVILHGSEHNKVYKYTSNSWSGESGDGLDLWCDIKGNSFNLDLSTTQYKWEITLYQGDGVFTTDSFASKISYDNLSYEWFDMVLNAGTILGSTNKRIQIAYGYNENEMLPTSNSNDTLVLQGRYVQLLSGLLTPQNLGSRAYIESYDATYGHVYPRSNSFTQSQIDQADVVRIYKHSNDPDEVLPTERVAVATTETENISLYVNDALNPDLGLITIDGYTVKENDLVLVKNQAYAKENGIYEAHANTGWNRAATFNSWGKFIGAILYVDNGSKNRGSNWESVASVGGELYNPSSTISGSSPLYFKAEPPIILFGGKIQYKIDLAVFTAPWDITNYTMTNSPVDGITLAVGMTIYAHKKMFTTAPEICKVTNIQDNTVTLEPLYTNIDEGTYIYVDQGKDCGKSVIRVRDGVTVLNIKDLITSDLSTARILKNSTAKTYITPYLGLSKDMAIKLLNGKLVNNTVSGTNTSWIRIKSINTTTWYITHDTLSEPLLSLDPYDSSIPYKYELRSYYRKSDENPFSCYEAPYLKLKINGLFYTGFELPEAYDVLVSNQYEPYQVNGVTYEVILPAIASIGNRYVNLEGIYQQFQQMSWESYRWTLLDYNGNIIQDTGRRYDRQMMVTFYGLSNEEPDNHYAAILYVADDANNILKLILYFAVDFDPQFVLNTDFVADFECSTQSVVLSYLNYTFINPSITNVATGLSYKYCAENYAMPGVDWDGSFTTSGQLASIHNLVNYDEGANPEPLPIYDMYEKKGSKQYYGLSATVMNGLNYEHTFGSGILSTRNDEQLIEMEGNEFYLETKIQLVENYCGKFLGFTIEDADNTSRAINIELGLPDNIDSGSLNADRNKVYIKINNRSDFLRKNASEVFSNFDIPDYQYFNLQCSTVTPVSGTSKEYDVFTVQNGSETLSLWYYKKVSTGNKIHYLNSPYDLGNLCLIGNTSSTIGPIYWVEDRGTLVLYTNPVGGGFVEPNSDSVNSINMTNTVVEDGKDISDPEYMPNWPEEGDESNFYWRENTSSQPDQYQPPLWQDMVGDSSSLNSQHLMNYQIMPRHSGTMLSLRSYIIMIKCYDFTSLYTHINSVTFAGDANNTTLVKSGDTILLEIKLQS